MTSPAHQRARALAEALSGYQDGVVIARNTVLIAAALDAQAERDAKVAYEAIHALHKGGTLEHCWYQACECEKIWKAVKEAHAIREGR